MAMIVEIDGSDAAGKTTVARSVVGLLRARGVRATVAPPASELSGAFGPGFGRRDPREQLWSEVEGYHARLDWAARRDGVAVLDRGAQTLMASCAARLVRAGVGEKDAWRRARDGFAGADAVEGVRYLLSFDDPADGLAMFWSREPEAVYGSTSSTSRSCSACSRRSRCRHGGVSSPLDCQQPIPRSRS